VNPVNNKVYVAQLSANSVMVIDGQTNDTATVAAGTGPNALAVNTADNRVYVANFSSDNVTVINGGDNSTVTIPVGDSPQGLDVNPVTNKIYVANYSSDNITVIDGATHGTSNVAAGDGPRAMAVNPVTNKVYVANYLGASVTVIDGATNGTATVPVGTNPRAVRVNPATNKIYVADYGSAKVTIIDGATNDTSSVAAGTNPYSLALDPVHNKIYAANYGSANVTVIDGATNTVNNVPAGANPYAVAADPVRGKIYVANYNGASVTMIGQANNWDTVITAKIGDLPNHATNVSRPLVTGTATTSWSPNWTSLSYVMSRSDYGSGVWNLAQTTSGKGETVSWQLNWGPNSLIKGENFISIVPLESQAATSNNLGLGTPMAGNLLTYPIYYVGYPSLAVTLTAFTASGQPGKVVLDWATASEHNSAEWIIDRSFEHYRGYVTIGSVQASGNSPYGCRYTFVDGESEPGRHYFYRLAERDADGTISYYGPVEAAALPPSFSLAVLALHLPNPCRPPVRIRYQAPEPGVALFRIYNLSGQQLRTLSEKRVAPGIYNLGWDGRDDGGRLVSSGVYLIRLIMGSRVATGRVTIIK
jgi:YVTN family beta-propeller protein